MALPRLVESSLAAWRRGSGASQLPFDHFDHVVERTFPGVEILWAIIEFFDLIRYQLSTGHKFDVRTMTALLRLAGGGMLGFSTLGDDFPCRISSAD